MTLQIYIPETSGNDPARHFEQAGIAELLVPWDSRPFAFEANQSPDTRGGMFYSWASPSEQGYAPGRQDWHAALPDPDKGLPAGRYWVGLPKRPLGPQDFQRTQQLDGPTIACADGHPWQWPNGLLLPHGHGLDPATGLFCRTVTRQYEHIYTLTEWARAHWEAAVNTNTFDFAACFRTAVELLQANYRITRDVVSRLGLLDDQVVQRVMFLCTDSETLFAIQQELEKKTTPPTPGT